MTAPSIHLQLNRFDGKSTATLEAIKASRAPSEELMDDLVELTGGEDVAMQVGATWLLRAYLEDGWRLSAARVRRLIDALPSVDEGFAALHVCQLAAQLDIPDEDADAFAGFLRRCLGHANTFVRAWAPDAFHHLAKQHPRFTDESRRVLEAALTDPAASVRARAGRLTGG